MTKEAAMPDEEQVQETGEDEKVRKFDLWTSQRLIALGFDPLTPVYATRGGFDHDIIRDALFESLHSDPTMIPFEWEPYHKGSPACIFPMEVELIQVVRVPCDPEDARKDEGDSYIEPEWYLRGWLGRCSLNPSGEIVRMHAYISQIIDVHGDMEPSGWVQVLREQPSKTRPFSLDGQLIKGTDYPVLT
jgi:hypothetical protein